MNRNDRKNMRFAVKKFCRISSEACDDLTEIIDELKNQEEQKLDNLPENLMDSILAENMEEAIEQLEDIQDQLEEMENCYSVLAELAGIESI